MGFWKQFHKKVKSLKDASSQYILPTGLSDDKLFAFTKVKILGLITMADGVADEKEIDMATEVIKVDTNILQYIGEDEAKEHYGNVVQALELAADKNPTVLKIETNKVLDEIAKASSLPQKMRNEIIFYAEEMAVADGKVDKDEVALVEKIAKALRVATSLQVTK